MPILPFVVLLLLAVAGAACPPPASFQHPGLLHTDAEFAWVRYWLSQSVDPWRAAYQQLAASGLVTGDTAPQAQSIIHCANVTNRNVASLSHDAHRAYQLALLWKLSDNTAYADQAVRVLNAWASTLVVLDGDPDHYAVAGTHGAVLANAAELLRAYPGWKYGQFLAFRGMVENVFLQPCLQWLAAPSTDQDVPHAAISLGAVQTVLAVAILSERPDLYTEAMSRLTTSSAPYALANAFPFDDPESGLAQALLAGLDQTRATLQIALIGTMAQMAWSQGCDLFAFANGLLLRGAEYVAKYNLGMDVPYTAYVTTGVSLASISDVNRGLRRPAWDLLYNHYAVLRNQSAPWSQAFADLIRPDAGPGAVGADPAQHDQVGWQALMHSYRVPDGFVYPYDMPWRHDPVGQVGAARRPHR